MKLDQLCLDTLVIVAEKDRDRVGILNELEKHRGRSLSSALFYTTLTRLENKGLLSRYMGRSPGLSGGAIDFYSITENGRKVLR